ncbi:fused MFS/spermidine synthase [Ferrovum sp. PN-J185]|uniref:fused MFS/spermidine synthase n=1 Tax=Ferrovum sp. PN-J185 TaxID=1356306 RepID=UPI000795CADC|nr:fused MFS/spermidine synthase [Ferrovum sp. PN-J185]KXW56547.1 spermidine synthase [Ferrovum sp. PN-J185]MCC6068105.1 fused MFS/spermidine synthase [Ferrovum sp. PN-J185]
MTYSVDIRESMGIRTLHFGSDWIQGAMKVSKPYQLVLDYTKEMMLSLILRDEGMPQQILLIGLGSASLAKFLYKYAQSSHIHIVEIDERVIHCARQFFKCPDNSDNFEVHCADGFDWLKQSKQQFDLIVVDGFDANAQAGRLDSIEFYQLCQSHLTATGIVTINLFNYRLRFQRSLRYLEQVFGQQFGYLPSGDEGNTIAFAGVDLSLNTPNWQELRTRAQQLHASTGLNLTKLITRWQKSF